MANGRIDPRDPRVRDQARAIFGDRADLILGLADRMQEPRSAAPDPAPRDAGKFLRQLAALYCDPSERGRDARDLVASILKDALTLVHLISQANPEAEP